MNYSLQELQLYRRVIEDIVLLRDDDDAARMLSGSHLDVQASLA